MRPEQFKEGCESFWFGEFRLTGMVLCVVYIHPSQYAQDSVPELLCLVRKWKECRSYKIVASPFHVRNCCISVMAHTLKDTSIDVQGATTPDVKCVLSSQYSRFLACERSHYLLCEHSTDLLFNHSIRVYLFAAEQGRQRMLRFDPELLYVAAALHDFGLIKKFSSSDERFEVDGATRPVSS
jgi:HD domain